MIKETIDQLIHSVAHTMGYEIYESSFLLKGENSQIVVKLDKIDGVSHQDCEKFSKQLSLELDAQEILSNYSLEVSSPGLNRKIRSLDEFSRFIGDPVKVVYNCDSGVDVIKGKVLNIVNDDIILQDERGTKTVSYHSVINANLDY